MSFILTIKKAKTKYVILLSIVIFIGNFSSILLINLINNASLNDMNKDLRDTDPNSQGIVQDDYTIEWLENPTFETPITPWYNTTEGDTSDISASTDFNQANFNILGSQSSFILVENPPQASNWTARSNPDFPAFPEWPEGGSDQYTIDNYGFWARHQWNEGPRQTPSVQWIHEVEMPVNMSDYVITSASVSGIVNATVNSNVDVNQALGDVPDGDNDATPQGYVYDFVRFYIKIADPNFNNIYEIAYNKTYNLGLPSVTTMADTFMNTISENNLIFYLTSVLSSNYKNFTIIVGMDIFCEDNCWTDRDEFTNLRIKSISLNFTYDKKINQFTSVAWNQIGDTITGSNIDIKNATLNFKYKIDKNWTTESPNSEIRVFINNNQFGETIKLSTATSTFQDAKVGGFDVTNLILKNVNITLSIKLYLADTFPLDQLYSFSIDNASLLISYTETTVEETTNLDIILNSENKTLEKSIEVTMGYDINITVMYKDSLNSFIPGANVSLIGVGGPPTLDEDLVYNQYSAVFSTTELSLGNNVFTIEASKKYYETALELINVKVIERNTELTLFLDEQDKTIDKSIEMIYGNDGNITITYRDIEQVPYTHISGATVELIGLATPENLIEDLSNEQYYFFIDTKDLGLGNSFLTVNAYKENYTTQSIRFKIEVLERSAYLDNIILNGIEIETIQIAWNELLTISASYNDSFTDIFIDDALVQLTGTGVSENFTENAPIEYSVVIDTELLKLGVNFLTISAMKENYTLATRIISISVTERESLLEVYLNGSLSSTFEFYTIAIGEELNVTVLYKDLDTDSFLDLANVKLIESGIPQNLTKHPVLDQYNISILAEDLGAGVKFLTISAKKTNYTLSSELITLIINEKNTRLRLYLNGTQYLNGETIQLEVTDRLNITVEYLDDITLNFLSGATVDLIGGATLTEDVLNEHYNITINILDLGSTLNRIMIRAQLPNFQTALIEFFIQVVERQSDGTLFLNGIDKTIDPYIELTIGRLLNVTINYYDNRTANPIDGATVQLNGDLTGFLNESLVYNQYSMIINTSNLGVGLWIFTIIAERANFELFIIQKMYLSVKRISTNITTVSKQSTFVIKPGESITLNIILDDLDFEETIKGAEVNYRWAFGDGTLSDNDNDGIYTVTLTNIPEGSYSLTITAYKGDNYDFESYEIVISVIRPPEELYLFQALAIIGAIAAAALITYLILYQKILKYPKAVRKVRKYSKSLRRTKDPSVNIISRDKAFEGTYKSEFEKASKGIRIKASEPSGTSEKILVKK